MAGKFGADFNSAQPSDSDLVKKGAQWIRDIKTRIKAFNAVCFNLETGQLLNNIVASASLKDLNPDPTGTWDEVDVNSKGQVTAGRNPTRSISATPYRWVYNYGTGVGPTGLIARSLQVDPVSGLNVATYSFVVPAGVTRLQVRVFGAGGGGGYNATPDTAGGGGGGGFTDTLVDVAEGDTFLVWAGEGGIGMTSALVAAKSGAPSKFERSALQYAMAEGGLPGTSTAPGFGGRGSVTSSVTGWGPNIDAYGQKGDVYSGGMGGGGLGTGTGTLSGAGGDPASSGAGANAGGSGWVVVDYWKS